ncbi:hypothetical protein AHMF7605_11775 [Adhaeribacter arboris]|uniref:Uncharacterized protein n=1 Tax=Adhaeribacter arboris TaxID=2072846 RepID=A0A2T2YF62_9BACT|nr:hypothetical protein [Adhaeribacter arboris]PSR54150.1 hypothetical protein AHMF7605_11775 [Adhaeribacter arboris]
MRKLILLALIPLLISCVEEKKKYTAFDRSYYKEELRNNFLDAGMEVDIAINGDSSENLQISNILFNDVWDRKFETQGLYKKWFGMGFEKITIIDGHFRYKKEHDALSEYMPE